MICLCMPHSNDLFRPEQLIFVYTSDFFTMMMISENDPLFKSSASSGNCHLVIGSTIHVTSRNCSCNLQ